MEGQRALVNRALRSNSRQWMERMSAVRRSCCFAFVTLMLTSTHQLRAQTATPGPFAASRTDSVAWQRVLVYVTRVLASDIVRAATDPDAQPWDIRLPPAEPQRQLLERQLRTLLHARTPTLTDSVTRRVDIGKLRIVHDTALVRVQMDETRRCRGSTRTSGSGWVDTVRVPRDPVQKSWGAGRSRGVLVGDRFGC